MTKEYILSKTYFNKRPICINYAIQVYEDEKRVFSGAVNSNEIQSHENVNTLLVMSIIENNRYNENDKFKTIKKSKDGPQPVHKKDLKEFKLELQNLSDLIRH